MSDHSAETTAADTPSVTASGYPSRGSETGLHDSIGRPIRVGDMVKMEVTANTDLHGEWSIYEVVARGMVPVLMYVRSEKDASMPPGSFGCALSDKYPGKQFLWVPDVADVRPHNEMTVFDG